MHFEFDRLDRWGVLISLGIMAGTAHIELPSVLVVVAVVECLTSMSGIAHCELLAMLVESPVGE